LLRWTDPTAEKQFEPETSCPSSSWQTQHKQERRHHTTDIYIHTHTYTWKREIRDSIRGHGTAQWNSAAAKRAKRESLTLKSSNFQKNRIESVWTTEVGYGNQIGAALGCASYMWTYQQHTLHYNTSYIYCLSLWLWLADSRLYSAYDFGAVAYNICCCFIYTLYNIWRYNATDCSSFSKVDEIVAGTLQ
jgi:hypothetical protein